MGDQHNENIPALTNQISDDVPDIKENLEWHKDVLQKLAAPWHDSTLASCIILPGYVNRPKFKWSDADQILIGPGQYHLAGTKNQHVYWASDLDITCVSLATNAFSHIYIDESEVASADVTLITASMIVDSASGPTWSDAKGGFYNGNDRWIFAVLADGSAEILEFLHDGGDYVQWGANIQCHALADLDDTWTDVTMKCPTGVSTKVLGWFRSVYVAESTNLFARTNGQTDTTGVNVGGVNEDVAMSTVIAPIITDTASKIEVKHSAAGDNQCGVYTLGWYFPKGA